MEGNLDKQWAWRGMGKGEQESMCGVDKMDTEENSQQRKLEIWKEEGLEWAGVNEGRINHGFGFAIWKGSYPIYESLQYMSVRKKT